MNVFYALFLVGVSFAIVAFGQPAWVNWLSPLAAALGYSIFWKALLSFSLKRAQLVCIAVLWYASVQLIQLSWMTSIEYHGYYILGAYAAFALCLGLPFGALTYFITSKKPLTWLRIGALAGMWTIMEWSRFHIYCGFSWNPAGIALAANPLSMQMAALTGVFGLSFWVMLTNLVGLQELWSAKHPQRGFLRWFTVALVPYVFGAAYFTFHLLDEKWEGKGDDRSFTVALVQTGLRPSQKVPLQGRLQEFLSPWVQWQRIFSFLKHGRSNNPSLIVLPEYTIPFSPGLPIYDIETATFLIKQEFGPRALKAFPPFHPPFGELRDDGNGDKKYFVSNAFFSQFLANFFQAEVVIGMDDRDAETKLCYSAGFYFSPANDAPQRYEKRILVPLAEYLPFEWCRSLVAGYGITDFYTHGREAKVFAGRQPFSLSICYEETFPEIVREGKIKGAELFINLTNDNWYPDSKLAKQHFDHGRLRAIENGTPLLRACNSGITAVVNARGEVVEQFNHNEGVLYAKIPRYCFSTLYTRYGDALIIGISLGLIIAYFLYARRLRIKRQK